MHPGSEMIGTVRTELTISRTQRLIATAALPLFATALFTGSFLLFLVEPMVAKAVLPALGGAPMVWNTCVVFFQAALLFGYGYALSAARTLDVRQHAVAHIAVLLLPLASLPFLVGPRAAPPPEANPVLWLLLWLTTAIGLPFFALSTGASVLQHWFARTDHASARDPYFLYGASNLGSLLALAAYPALIEPALPLRVQSRLWAAAYTMYVALVCGCSLVVRLQCRPQPRADAAAIDAASQTAAPTALQRGRWLLLAFVPSSLMLAVTSYVTTDVAAVPLLWVLPLAIYLATFIVAFGSGSDRARAIATKAVPIVVVLLVICMVGQIRGPLTIVLPLHLVAFGLLALQCHASLAAERPDPSRLTEFYFWISAGGMLGGLFNALAAPLLFNTIVEYPLVVVVACALLPAAQSAWTRRSATADAAVPIAIAALAVGATVLFQKTSAAAAAPIAGGAIAAIVTFAQRRRPLRFAASLGAVLLATAWLGNIG